MAGLDTLDGRRHFLVIENDPDDAFLIRRAFTSIPNCTSFVCRNTSEAKAYMLGAGLYAQRQNYPYPDTILCDLRLADECGAQFIDWLKKTSEVREVPVIVLTGNASPTEMTSAHALGARRVLRKPGNFELLKQMLSELVADFNRTPSERNTAEK